MSKENKKKGKGLGKFILGAGIGAALGLLFAPKPGKETRKDLKKKLDELVEKVKGIDKKELVAEIQDKIEEIKEELADLDKETVMEIAKEKALEIKEKAEDLYEIAKAKATPVIEEAADEVRKKALAVVKDIEKKLSK